MIYALLIITAFFVVSMIWAAIDAVLDDNRAQKVDDYNYCYNCLCGFCMYTPDSDECREWRKEHGET